MSPRCSSMGLLSGLARPPQSSFPHLTMEAHPSREWLSRSVSHMGHEVGAFGVGLCDGPGRPRLWVAWLVDAMGVESYGPPLASDKRSQYMI